MVNVKGVANGKCKTLRYGETSGLIFSAGPRHFLDWETETSKHLSPSARRSAKIRVPDF